MAIWLASPFIAGWTDPICVSVPLLKSTEQIKIGAPEMPPITCPRYA